MKTLPIWERLAQTEEGKAEENSPKGYYQLWVVPSAALTVHWRNHCVSFKSKGDPHKPILSVPISDPWLATGFVRALLISLHMLLPTSDIMPRYFCLKIKKISNIISSILGSTGITKNSLEGSENRARWRKDFHSLNATCLMICSLQEHILDSALWLKNLLVYWRQQLCG